MKSLIEWISRHWAKIAIAAAIVLLGGSKLKRRKKQARVAGDLYRAEVRKDLNTLSDTNRKAKDTADAADQAAEDEIEKFKGRVDEIANSDEDIGSILSDYRKRVRQ